MKNLKKVCDSTIQKESNRVEFCFQNGNLILPFKITLMAKYTFKEIADILNIDCQEVCRQFNQMARESGYCLFN